MAIKRKEQSQQHLIFVRYRKSGEALIDWCNQMLKKHHDYIREYGEDMPFVSDWKWEGFKDID